MEAKFFAPVQTGPGARPPFYTMGTGSFPGVKRPERGVDQPPPSGAKVKKKSRAIHLRPLWAFVACSKGKLYLNLHLWFFGVHGWHNWLRHYAKSRKDKGSIPDDVIAVFPT